LSKVEEVIELAKRRGFFWQAFSIYGGQSGFLNYAPLGVLLKDSVIEAWKRNLLRHGAIFLDSPNVTPEDVFRASGHLERFSDIAARCRKCGTKFKAESLLTETGSIPKTSDEAKELLLANRVKCPVCGSVQWESYDFNVMFRIQTSDGPNLYLRPETAQGIFTDFRLLLNFNRGKLPMITAQLGKGFRNEISPRQGLIRMREFNMGEVEAFLDREALNFPNLPSDSVVKLVPNTLAETRLKLSEAVANSMITQDHAFFLDLAVDVLKDVGLSGDSIRLRQHRKEELSHYARDCWDAEADIDGEWVEVIGIADRGNYDLSRHQQFSGENLEVTEGERSFVPSVIEPAFGIDRICFALLVNAIRKRENGYKYLSLHPDIAPYHCAFLPLQNRDGLDKLAEDVFFQIRKRDPRVTFDQSGSIGKRYARQDEIGTPYCITFDYQSLEDRTVTIRERDTTSQKRINIDRILDLPAEEGRNPFTRLYS